MATAINHGPQGRGHPRSVGRRLVRWTQKLCPSCGHVRTMPMDAGKCGRCEEFGTFWGSFEIAPDSPSRQRSRTAGRKGAGVV